MYIKNSDPDFQNPAQPAAAAVRASFPVSETHGIALWPENRLLAHSDGLNWRSLYASLATERSWTATLPAIDHHCVAYCVQQAATITRRFDGAGTAQTAVLGPRQLGTIPAGVSSDWQFDGSAEVLLLYLHRSMIDGVAEELLERDPRSVEILPLLGTVDPLIEQLALTTLSVLRRGDQDSSLYIESVAQAIAVQLLHRHSAGARRTHEPHAATATPPTISAPGHQRVIEFIDSALDQDLSLATLAATAGMSPFYFARAFRHETGESPHQYLLRRRIERARELLAATATSLAEIALATGFSSQSHLTSTFRRLVGVTPGEYRRRA